MLAVVSAVVAFDAWPGGNVAAPAQTLILTDKAPPIRVSAHSSAASATPLTRGTGAGRTPVAAGGAGGHRTLAGSAPGRSLGGARPGAGTPATTVPSLPHVPSTPDVPSADNIVESISNPDTTATQIADGTQAVTDTAGGSLNTVSPDAGTTVTQAGQTAAQAVRDLPLPGHILPGH